ncbi:MAG TPA: tetratricopeptide repeat protein [Candidatus Dormibacteraeota bacterium]|nr:tetratricopeptide repeat protein [Candidatus Dormibacteraeota bacterium]
MANSFCTQCGATLLPDARFCTACGQRAGGGPRITLRGPGLGRWAPLLVLAVVAGLGGLAVALGTRAAAPPNVPPPRGQQAQAPAGMPDNHPPLEVPEDVRKVIAKMADSAQQKPDDLEAWRQLGFVQYRAGQVDSAYLSDATATYSHVLEKAPDDLDSLRALGNIAYDRNDPTRAMEFYRRYLTLKPDDLGIQTDLATMQLAAKQYDDALAGYEAVLRTDPKFFQAQFNLAIAYRAKGEDELAVAALRRAREIAPDDDTRQRVDQLVAHVSGGGPPPGAAPGADDGSGNGGGGDLHGAVEAIFRSHPIVGSRIDRIDWTGDDAAKVLLREFPMASMPPMVRQKFLDRIRGGLRQAKSDHQVTDVVTVELVDADSGAVMETIAE